MYGTDHFAFSNATANSGFHQKVTTPAIGSVPATTTNPIFYAFQQYAAMGVLHYSRGPSNAVPTPLTTLQSSSAIIPLGSSASTNVINTAGMSVFYGIAVGTYYITSSPTTAVFPQLAVVYYDATGPFFKIANMNLGAGQFVATGTQLVFQNTGVDAISAYWTLQILRAV